MTAIVGFAKDGRVYIGSDSMASSDEHTQICEDDKVFIKKEFLFGFSSSYRFGQIIKYNFSIPFRGNKYKSDRAYLHHLFIPELRKCLEDNKFTSTDHNGTSVSCLIGYRGHLYTLQDDFSLIEPSDKYDCIGSGYQYCMGAMAIAIETMTPRLAIESAIKVAILNNPYVGGDVIIKEKG